MSVKWGHFQCSLSSWAAHSFFDRWLVLTVSEVVDDRSVPAGLRELAE